MWHPELHLSALGFFKGKRTLCYFLAKRQMSRLGKSANSSHVVELRCDPFPHLPDCCTRTGTDMLGVFVCAFARLRVYACACRATCLSKYNKESGACGSEEVSE